METKELISDFLFLLFIGLAGVIYGWTRNPVNILMFIVSIGIAFIFIALAANYKNTKEVED